MIQAILPILLIIILLGEIYTCHLLHKFTKKKSVVWAYLIFLASIIATVLFYYKGLDKSKGQTAESMQIMAMLLFFLLPKVLFSIALFLEDIFRISRYTTNKFIFKKKIENKRSVYLTRVVLTLSALTALTILYGIFVGKYDYEVRKDTIQYKDLPTNFDGLKILQISDLHVGSWDNKKAIEKGINLINQQDYDLLVFTGDFVNTLATEANPWISILQKIKTPKYGKYAILGNHDYGEYVKWENDHAKDANFTAIKENIKKSGFELLLNENRALVNNNDTLYVLGVENWGLKFKKAGDLKRTTANIPENAFKIVLTHDPSHWDAEIVGHKQKYQLTLSGHTHGMQFGIRIPKVIEWSPASWIYPEWGGLYKKENQYIYVNRGFGFHAYSGRIGIMPEITLLELKKSK